jgi:predicted acylesterase/phospholipase RssA
MNLATQKPLRLGLVMAGAVSAGAYTGGVVDYLFQVLDNWEKAKQLNDPSIPKHNVRIDIMSGASAGGMTCGMAAAALQQDRCPVTEDKRKDEEYKKKNVSL